MTHEMIWELIGYLGSALVVVSLLMSSVIKLRIINTIGSLIFCVYALVIHSYPTAVMNGALVAINIYFLAKLINKEKSFTLREISGKDASLLYMLEKYEGDIEKFFPGWKERGPEINKVYLAFRDDILAGVTMGKAEGESFTLLLDYSTPQFRDLKLGSFVYGKLNEAGYKRLYYDGNSRAHMEYLEKMGFKEENGILVK